MSEESPARPVRLARSDGPGPRRAVRVAALAGSAGPLSPTPAGSTELRSNTAATRRAVRLATLYAVGIVAVYGALAAAAFAAPPAGSTGSTEALLLVGLLAVVLAAVGVVFALGAAPRSVELREHETVVVGRFGRRYRFPAQSDLRPIVLRRFPSGWLASSTVESVEIGGGSTRRSFLLDEGLLESRPRAEPDADP